MRLGPFSGRPCAHDSALFGHVGRACSCRDSVCEEAARGPAEPAWRGPWGGGLRVAGFEQDASRLDTLFERHERLAGWLSEAGHTLRYDPDRLATVEASIDSWHDDSEVAPMLSNEVGTFLGTVLVRVVNRHFGHIGRAVTGAPTWAARWRSPCRGVGRARTCAADHRRPLRSRPHRSLRPYVVTTGLWSAGAISSTKKSMTSVVRASTGPRWNWKSMTHAAAGPGHVGTVGHVGGGDHAQRGV